MLFVIINIYGSGKIWKLNKSKLGEVRYIERKKVFNDSF